MTPPTPVVTHVWDGTRSLPAWLPGSQYTWDGEQLVIHHDDHDIQLRAGWWLIHWSDGLVTVASPLTASRVYGPDGPWARAEAAAALYDRWVKAGPPPLGTSTARWWDTKLIELRAALDPPTPGTAAGEATDTTKEAAARDRE